jgi:hypothetical protein
MKVALQTAISALQIVLYDLLKTSFTGLQNATSSLNNLQNHAVFSV